MGAHLVDQPRSLDLKKDRGLTIEWADGGTSYFSIAYLRRMSPSADQRELLKEMDRNPLTVLPSRLADRSATLVAESAELVGNYALRIAFSDGHDTGIFSWAYLRSIDPALKEERRAGSGDAAVTE
ncbi:MAG: DUF971 domain-containing protein [Pyrinomonadaceae bacterium]|nr:DUF971 domain-containing protein [Phycisphaerales bacterium]